MSVNPKTFDKDYYYNVCLGSEEFKKSGGLTLHPNVKKMIDSIALSKDMEILEIGCGRGDTALHIAKKVKSIIGIDYSSEAIKIAKKIQKKYPKRIQEKSKFLIMDATRLKFEDNSFDLVLLIDTLDHLAIQEQEKMFKEISRVLKSGGKIFLRTCTNRILLNITFPYYIYPLNKILTWVDQKMKRISYAPLPKNPRTPEQEYQHINEPDYFQLQKLFKKFQLKGKIESQVGFLKAGSNIRTLFYNFAITFYPLSKYYPLNVFFASSFICNLKVYKKQ